MTPTAEADWNPGTYNRFRGHRLRPALDLLHALPPLPPGPIVDLGCGGGLAGDALARLDRPLCGVDLSPAMLEQARAAGHYTTLEQQDIEAWQPRTAPALIFSNAALHWVGDHATLLPRLVGMLAPGGTLAVQMPHQNNAPSHRLWVQLAEEYFPRRAFGLRQPSVRRPAEYHRLLNPLGHLDLWETEYYQLLEPCADGHPVRRFTESTYARPILQMLDPAERDRLVAGYEAVIDKAYPAGEDGSVLFPFRRLFFLLTIDDPGISA